MPADLPPSSSLTSTVNAAAADLGVGRPPVLDRLDKALAHCPPLKVDREAALALRVDVDA